MRPIIYILILALTVISFLACSNLEQTAEKVFSNGNDAVKMTSEDQTFWASPEQTSTEKK